MSKENNSQNPFDKYDHLFDEQEKKYHPEAYEKEKQRKTFESLENTPKTYESMDPETIKKIIRTFMIVVGFIIVFNLIVDSAVIMNLGRFIPTVIIIIVVSQIIKKSKN